MSLADGIRKHGFRKWYERELLRSHAHLLLTLAGAMGLMAVLEAAWRLRSVQDQALNLVAGLLCAGVGMWALRRYLLLLSAAEMAASQADCPSCETYGRLELVQANADGNEVQVRCRKCSHGWHISGG